MDWKAELSYKHCNACLWVMEICLFHHWGLVCRWGMGEGELVMSISFEKITAFVIWYFTDFLFCVFEILELNFWIIAPVYLQIDHSSLAFSWDLSTVAWLYSEPMLLRFPTRSNSSCRTTSSPERRCRSAGSGPRSGRTTSRPTPRAASSAGAKSWSLFSFSWSWSHLKTQFLVHKVPFSNWLDELISTSDF